MFFLPLGLAAKVFRFPWVTLVLSFVILAVTFPQFKKVEDMNKVLGSDGHVRVLAQRLQIAGLICQKNKKLDGKFCSDLQELGKTKFTSALDLSHKLQMSFIKFHISQKDAGEITKWVMSTKQLAQAAGELKSSTDFQELEKIESQFADDVTANLKKNNMLARSNFNFFSLLKAQFIHGSFSHLFGNLIFLIGLSIFVELRLGSAGFCLVYLLSGFAGMTFDILTNDVVYSPLLGASANIAGISGAFTVLFWQKRMRIFASLMFFYNKIVMVPVYFFIPVLLVAGDLAGALSPVNSGVAHKAHLGGYLAGALLAWMLAKFNPVPKDFTYYEEFMLFKKLPKEPLSERASGLIEILKVNPENRLLLQECLEICAKQEWQALSASQKKFLENDFAKYLGTLNFAKETDRIFFHKVNLSWPGEKILKQVSSKQIQGFIKTCEKNNDARMSLFLIEALIKFFPDLGRDARWTTRVQQLKEQAYDSRAS